ncbi:Ku protein [Desulfosporosinus sp. PR]|uniref:non-homologous end joining protein Ku n=1 Tax=Candidatus Desulfosporosinus nitrosoreducens TaxID=3401928 RepID=UPI0027E7493F|nr:Ku protein [Desulfosporosinus sp. PR]MDQ7093353.1 Ku protein [Desulfosporosinus sp. PR]
MHTLWKGSISFGLVNVPVKMHAATEAQEFKFNYLHKECQHRIRSIKKCPHCDQEVDMADLVKGYEYEKDHYVILQDEDLASLEQPLSRSIDILDFVDLSEIDPIYYEKSYYLSPEETAQKAYRLLSKAMEESGKVALARITMRSKQHLACLRVFEEGLVLETMHYPKEIRHMDLVWDQVVPTETELTMARQLIDNLARPFEPQKYRDELHEQMAEMIESKVAGESFNVEAPAKGGQVVDLMEALRASIAMTEHENGKIEPKKPTSKVQKSIVESNENEVVLESPQEDKPKSTLTPRKRTTRRAKGA